MEDIFIEEGRGENTSSFRNFRGYLLPYPASLPLPIFSIVSVLTTRFFHDGRRVRRGRVLCALRKIRAIADLFAVQSMFTFYASSILLTYDSADPPAEGGGDEEEEVEVRMIDFAHAVPQESMAETPADKGYLYGARNVSVFFLC